MSAETKDMKIATYEQFGAVGDGVADDMPAIVACHEYANANMLPVKARDGAKYYIGGRNITAMIKTDTDFGDAEFIIDDRNLESVHTECFRVQPDSGSYEVTIPNLERGQKKVDFPHDGRVYVRVKSSERKIFIREGLNQNNGTDQNDCFIVDADGNILTDIDWDYAKISEARIKPANDRPIAIRGGKFTTIANQWKSEYRYHSRGFNISRSNVTIEGVTHYVTGELDHGAPYAGFISISEAVDVTVRDCLLTPHFTYQTESKIPTKKVSMGSYDLSVNASIGVKLIGIHQTIDIMDSRYWGLMGSNFCKDMYLEGCVMSRFDAHQGVTNATIRGCTLGHMCLNLIGHGNFLIEDSQTFGNALISLRPDYGSTFDGIVTIRNCTWKPRSQNMTVLYASNSGNHDFGYVCHMPRRVYIDGLKILDGDIGDESTRLYVLPDYDRSFSSGKPHAYVPTEYVRIRNVTTESGRKCELCAKPEEYPYIVFVDEG